MTKSSDCKSHLVKGHALCCKMLSCTQKEVIASVQQTIDIDIDASRRLSLNLNKSLTMIQLNLVAQQSAINRTSSSLVSDFTAFSGTIREYLNRPPDTLGEISLPQSPSTRLAATLDDLRRLAAEFRHELNSYGAQERSVWKRLIGAELTRRFYERLRSDVASFSTRQLRELADTSSVVDLATTSDDWARNYELDDDSPDGSADRLASIEGRYALLNADVPTMDLADVIERVNRELSYYADALDVDTAVKVKVEDVMAKIDDLTSSVESLRRDCGPQSDDDFKNLVR